MLWRASTLVEDRLYGLAFASGFVNLAPRFAHSAATRSGRPGVSQELRTRTGVSAMKVTVERAALLKSLGHVHRVVERRNTIPILSNVSCAAEDGGLRLKATDLDMEVTETIPADVASRARPRCRRM